MPQIYPVPPPAPIQAPDEPRAHFAARCFCAVMADAGAVIMMSDELIELAAYGAKIATDARQMSPQYYERIADTERQISATIRARRAAADQDAAAALDTTIQPPPPGRPNGPAVPLSPYPSTQPPAGTYADLEPARGTRTNGGTLIAF